MLIALDIGNNHVTIGGFCGDDIQFVASMATDDRQTGEQYACSLQSIFALYEVDRTQFDGVVLSSVVPSMIPIMQKAIRLLSPCRVLTLGPGVKTGLNIRSDQPRSLGSDRVAGAVWAAHQGKLPCVVVDLGTAITFTAVDRDGALVGSAIAPGMIVAHEALSNAAAQIPVVGLSRPPRDVMGRTTTEALQIGAVYGTACMIDGMIARFGEALGEMPEVLVTGGSAPLVLPHLHTPITYDPELALRGLALIWQRNHR